MKSVLKNFFQLILVVPFFMVLSTVFIVNRELAIESAAAKSFWFYIAMAFVSLSAVIVYFVQRRNIKVSVIDFLFLFFALFVLWPGNIQKHAGIENRYIVFCLIVLLYYYLRVFVSQSPKSVYWICLFFIFTGLVEAVWGITQLYGIDRFFSPNKEVTGSFSTPVPYVGYLVIVAPMAFYNILSTSRILKLKIDRRFNLFYLRWALSFLTFCLIIFIVPMVYSRISWIACIAGCLITFFYYRFSRRPCMNLVGKHRCVPILYTLTVTFIAVGMYVGTYLMKHDVTDKRQLIWKLTSEIIKDNPLGVGIGNFPGKYGETQANYFASGQGTMLERELATSPYYAYNDYLHFSAELGVFPSLLLLALVLVALYYGIKNKNTMATGSLVAISLLAFLFYPFNILPFLIAFVLLLVLCGKDNSGRKLKKSKTKAALGMVGGSLIISVISVTFCLRERYYVFGAYEKWSEANVLYKEGCYEDIIDKYMSSYKYLYHQADFMEEYADCLSQIGRYEDSNFILKSAVRISSNPIFYEMMGENYQEIQDYISAEKCFLKATCMMPHRAKPYFHLIGLYVESGQKDKMEFLTNYLLRKETRVSSTLMGMIDIK